MKKNQRPGLLDKLPAYFSSSDLVHLAARMIKKIIYYARIKKKIRAVKNLIRSIIWLSQYIFSILSGE